MQLYSTAMDFVLSSVCVHMLIYMNASKVEHATACGSTLLHMNINVITGPFDDIILYDVIDDLTAKISFNVKVEEPFTHPRCKLGYMH